MSNQKIFHRESAFDLRFEIPRAICVTIVGEQKTQKWELGGSDEF